MEKFVRFRIGIIGLYEWGVGTINSYGKQIFDEVIESFAIANGLNITSAEKLTCTSFEGTYRYVYAHPMELTGTLPEKELSNLVEFLNYRIMKDDLDFVLEETIQIFEEVIPLEENVDIIWEYMCNQKDNFIKKHCCPPCNFYDFFDGLYHNYNSDIQSKLLKRIFENWYPHIKKN